MSLGSQPQNLDGGETSQFNQSRANTVFLAIMDLGVVRKPE